jgi:electron-transferring-flavoprotein dehydrogenase
MARHVRPSEYQPELPRDKLILNEAPADENIEVDVLIVGAGPAGLACAIELANLARKDNESGNGIGDLSIAVLEKAGAVGDHCLSGAVINPTAFTNLFPDLRVSDFPFRAPVKKESVHFLTKVGSVRMPTPPTMKNHGYQIASLCEVARWLASRAEEMGVDIFAGYPAEAMLVNGHTVRGVRTAPTGLDRDGKPMSNYTPGTDVVAKVTCLAEGTRGSLSQAYFAWQNVTTQNPQIYALGVKEIWETKKPLDAVIHTMGWPLPRTVFGGSFMYPLEDKLLAIGLVAGLDYEETGFDIFQRFQEMKTHSFFREYLDGGEMVEWGAKTIPEGGFYAIPDRRYGHGVIILGDAAGFVNVPALKGIHYAMQSGIYGARAVFEALKNGATSAPHLAPYDGLVNDSFIMDDLYRVRNMRSAFKGGFFAGGIKAAAMTLTGGKAFGKKIAMKPDAAVRKHIKPAEPFVPDNTLTFSKVDAVFKSGNATRDTVPSHLIVEKDVGEDVARMYQHMCPAGVYEVVEGRLQVNAPNCVDCKATDVIGPRWTVREGGSGPAYKRM